jgi:hypothetical protein
MECVMVAVLVACLISVPTDCRTHEIPLFESMPVMQWQEAQLGALAWLRKHPDLVKLDLRIVRGQGV